MLNNFSLDISLSNSSTNNQLFWGEELNDAVEKQSKKIFGRGIAKRIQCFRQQKTGNSSSYLVISLLNPKFTGYNYEAHFLLWIFWRSRIFRFSIDTIISPFVGNVAFGSNC